MSANTDLLERQLDRQRELEQDLTFRFAIVNKILEAQVVALIRDTPLNLTDFRVLRVIEVFGPLSVSELSRQMHVDRALISRAASRLEGLGLLASGADPQSQRKKILSHSDEGRALMARLGPRFAKRRALVEDTVGPDAMAGLWQAVENLSRMETDLG